MENKIKIDNKNLILHNPETGKTYKLQLGFSWVFFLFGVFTFFFRGMIKEGIFSFVLLVIFCTLFDNEVGYYPLIDFKFIGMGICAGLAVSGNFFIFERFLKKGYKLNLTSPAAAKKALKDGDKFLKNAHYAKIKQDLEMIAAVVPE